MNKITKFFLIFILSIIFIFSSYSISNCEVFELKNGKKLEASINAIIDLKILDNTTEYKTIDNEIGIKCKYEDIGVEINKSIYKRREDGITKDYKNEFNSQFDYYIYDPIFLFFTLDTIENISFDINEVDMGIGFGLDYKYLDFKTSLNLRDEENENDQKYISKNYISTIIPINEDINLELSANYNINLEDKNDYTASGDVALPIKIGKYVTYKIGYEIEYDNISKTDINSSTKVYNKLMLGI